jgi:hypothetical protein
MMTDDNRPLIGGIVLAGAIVLGLLAVLCWTGVLPVDHGARTTISLALGIAAVADLLVGVFFLTRSRQS